MQAQDMHIKMDSPKPHPRGYYHEDEHKNSPRFIVFFAELKANGSDGFLSWFVFYLATLKDF